MFQGFTLSNYEASPYGWIGLMATWGFVVLVAAVIGASRIERRFKLLIMGALALRVLGAILRYYVAFDIYGGHADATSYYEVGLQHAERLWEGDFSVLGVDFGGRWWGTRFVYVLSAIVLAVIGPTLFGEFLVFALLSYLGLVLIVLAFQKTTPTVASRQYARWVWLFPSLWYWPSSVGKESLVLLGIGIALAAYARVFRGLNWFAMGLGLFLITSIRPQVAAVVVLSMLFAEWLLAKGRRDATQILRGVAILVIGVLFIRSAISLVGVESIDAGEVQDYMDATAGRGAGGASGLDAMAPSWSSLPLAFVNVLFRPFPWEVRTLMMALSSAELWLFWGLAFYRRRELVLSLKSWRTNRLLSFAVPFVILYTASIGLLIANMGIIARQRIFIFPLVFMFFEPHARAVATKARSGLYRTLRSRTRVIRITP